MQKIHSIQQITVHLGLRELNHTAFVVYGKIMALELTASGPLFFSTPQGLCDLILS